MKIETTQELEKLIKLLRKTGVETLKMGEFELKLSSNEPQSKYKQRISKSNPKESKELPTASLGGFTEEEVLFWSSTPPGPAPEKDQ